MSNIEFYEVKDAKRTVISFTFDIEYKRDDSIKKTLMQRMLLNYTNNLKTIKDYSLKKDELYIMGCNNELYMDKDRAIYNIYFIIPKVDIIKEFNLDDAISFIYDTLFNPIVKDEQFEINAFLSELNYLKDKEKDYPHNIGEYASDIFLDFVDEEKKTLIHYDEYLEFLNNTSSKEVYDYYLKNIKNNDYSICVFGNNEDKNIVLKVLNKYFKPTKPNNRKLNGYEYMPVLDYKEKTMDINYNQSVLSMFYQFTELNEEDQIKLEMLYYFLNSRENDLLYTSLRYKNNLVYHTNVRYSLYFGMLTLVIFFDYKLLDRIEAEINNLFTELKNKDNYELYKNRLVKAISYDLLDNLDNPFYVVNDTFNKKYLPDNCLDKKLEIIKTINYESFRGFLDRMMLTRKMIMKSGDTND